MSDIFSEVDEEVKRDKVEMFFRKNAGFILTALVLLVIGVGAFRAYSYFQEKAAMEAGSKYEAALALLAEGKSEEARSALASFSKDAPAGYKMLARFREASELAKTDAAAGAKALDSLASDATMSKSLQDLAKVRAGQILVDTVSFADLQARLEPLAAQGQAWRLAARETLGLGAYKAGTFDKAATYFEQILIDPEATRNQRDRAEMMMSMIRGGAVQVK